MSGTTHELRYRLLGPLTVLRPATREPVDLGSPKQRAVLALLLLDRGRVVSTERLVDAVWEDDPPPSALASLQAYVSNLRRALRDGAATTSPIVRRAPGYLLDVPADEVDVAAFAAAGAAARGAAEEGRWSDALSHADAALALWRGPLLEDLHDPGWLRADAARFDELRAELRELRVSALLAGARVLPALVEAQSLRAEQPLRDRACWLHVLALYRAGRTPEALEELRRHAVRLDDELGLEPGAELRELELAILRQEPALAAWPRSPGWRGAAEVRTPRPQAEAAPPPAAEAVAPRRGDGLVGRAREAEEIDRMLDEARSVGVRALVLTGPAGIGKTRLAEELLARGRDLGFRDVWARCPEEEGVPAWWPIRQLVRALGGDPDAVLVPPPGADIDAARFAVYERVLGVLQAAAVTTPLVVVVDDVQWADPTSARCLAYLVGALRDVRVALVLTLRDGERAEHLAPLLGAIARAEGGRQLAVPPLGQEDVAELAGRVAGTPLGEDESRLLAERTGGNPLFVSEYARLSPEERRGAPSEPCTSASPGPVRTSAAAPSTVAASAAGWPRSRAAPSAAASGAGSGWASRVAPPLQARPAPSASSSATWSSRTIGGAPVASAIASGTTWRSSAPCSTAPAMSPSGAAVSSCPASTVPNPCRSSTRTTPTLFAPPSAHRRSAAPSSRDADAPAGDVAPGTEVTQSRVAAPGGRLSTHHRTARRPADRAARRSGECLGHRGGVGGDPLPGEQPDRSDQGDGERRGAHREAGGDRVRRGLGVRPLGAPVLDPEHHGPDHRDAQRAAELSHRLQHPRGL